MACFQILPPNSPWRITDLTESPLLRVTVLFLNNVEKERKGQELYYIKVLKRKDAQVLLFFFRQTHLPLQLCIRHTYNSALHVINAQWTFLELHFRLYWQQSPFLLPPLGFLMLAFKKINMKINPESFQQYINHCSSTSSIPHVCSGPRLSSWPLDIPLWSVAQTKPSSSCSRSPGYAFLPSCFKKNSDFLNISYFSTEVKLWLT